MLKPDEPHVNLWNGDVERKREYCSITYFHLRTWNDGSNGRAEVWEMPSDPILTHGKILIYTS